MAYVFPPFPLQNIDIIEQLMQLETMSYPELLRIVQDFFCNQLDSKIEELVNRIKRRIENNIMVGHEREMFLRKLESENQELKSEIYDYKHRFSSSECEIQRPRDCLSTSGFGLRVVIRENIE